MRSRFLRKNPYFFRQINTFTKEVTKELIWRNFFRVIAFCNTFPHCGAFIITDFTKILRDRKNLNFLHCENAVDFFVKFTIFFVVFHVFTELFVLIVDIKKFSIIPYTDSELWCWNLQTCELKIQRLASSVGLDSSILT